jgi:hypothetical protein
MGVDAKRRAHSVKNQLSFAMRFALCVMKGDGLMLWIMTSPGRGLRDIKSKLKRMNIDKRGEFHGEDHPGNQ